MKTKIALTRLDFLVVLGCIAFLLLNIGAIGSGGRRRAKEAVCLSNLRKWGVIFEIYTQDNSRYFLSGDGGSSGAWWIELLEPYYMDSKLLICPEATKPSRTGGIGQTPFKAWSTWASHGECIGSYGPNGWICNPPISRTHVWGRSPISNYWRSPDVGGAHNIPVFLDMWFVDAWPRDIDGPPGYYGPPWDRVNLNEMMRVCVNRHNGAINGLFMDWSARKIGLKELWTLKWHRAFDTEGPWTRAGGVTTYDWPEWMWNFKEY